jgi:hypothetical protein
VYLPPDAGEHIACCSTGLWRKERYPAATPAFANYAGYKKLIPTIVALPALFFHLWCYYRNYGKIYQNKLAAMGCYCASLFAHLH